MGWNRYRTKGDYVVIELFSNNRGTVIGAGGGGQAMVMTEEAHRY